MDQPETGEAAMSARKRTSLDAVFGAAETLPTAASAEKHPEKQGAPESAQTGEAPRAERAGDAKRRPSVKQHTAYLSLAVHDQLRKLAFEENRKMHDYLLEGLDRVFADRGLPALKDIS
jgi:hypothetical protein